MHTHKEEEQVQILLLREKTRLVKQQHDLNKSAAHTHSTFPHLSHPIPQARIRRASSSLQLPHNPSFTQHHTNCFLRTKAVCWGCLHQNIWDPRTVSCLFTRNTYNGHTYPSSSTGTTRPPSAVMLVIMKYGLLQLAMTFK